MPTQTKSNTVRKMLARPKGTTIAAICDKTGWQRHSVHAFLSGLRKSGSTIERDGQGKGASYRLTSQPEVVE